MAFKRSDQQASGRFVQGGTAELKGNRLGWWERKILPKSSSDVEYIVTRKYAGRPDLLAYDMYGRASLQWLVMQFNNVSDIHVDFIEGTKIMLPTRSRVFGELLTRAS